MSVEVDPSPLDGVSQNIPEEQDLTDRVVVTENQTETVFSDPLQVAAQVYPWLYMTSTLDACFKTANETAKDDSDVLSQELKNEESEPSDQQTRFNIERTIQFVDEIESNKLAPEVMQRFLAHGDACSEVEVNALKLSSVAIEDLEDEGAPMWVFNNALDIIESLHKDASRLEEDILAQTSQGYLPDGEEDGPSSSLASIFSACMPILKGRTTNLTMAQQLVEGAKENLAMSLHLQSLESEQGNGDESGDEDEEDVKEERI